MAAAFFRFRSWVGFFARIRAPQTQSGAGFSHARLKRTQSRIEIFVFSDTHARQSGGASDWQKRVGDLRDVPPKRQKRRSTGTGHLRPGSPGFIPVPPGVGAGFDSGTGRGAHGVLGIDRRAMIGCCGAG